MKKLQSAVLSVILVMCLSGCSSKSASIGIIGGADGPTSVFVTSRLSWPAVCCIGVVIAAIVVALLIHHNKKKK